MDKNVQISRTLFDSVGLLLDALNDVQLEPSIATLHKLLTREFDEKRNALLRREAFSKYKTAPPETIVREKHRTDYLNLNNIHKNWRTQTETSL